MVTSPATLAANLKGFRKGHGLLASTGTVDGEEVTDYCCLGVGCEIIGIERALIEGQALPSALSRDLRDEFYDAYPWMPLSLPDNDHWYDESIETLLVQANDSSSDWDEKVIPLLEFVEANFDRLS